MADRRGLSAAEAMARLRSDGYNELPSARSKSPWRIVGQVVREPMFILLLAAAAVYLVLGDRGEALLLAASVFFIIGITFIQERKTERALEALRDLASPRARVVRDGEANRIASREVVRGDLILLEEGDRIAADAIVLSCSHLCVDESLLTGESMPVKKRSHLSTDSLYQPGGDDLPCVFSGTLVTQGSGMVEVIATGLNSEIGRIGAALQSVVEEPSPLQRQMRRAVMIFAGISAALCLLVVVLHGLVRDGWLNGLLAGITLAMANVPEEMPVVVTVFLALGARRIAQHGVLTRRSDAIEALGATTVLCVDKTGTLTENRMSVQRLWVDGTAIELDGATRMQLPALFHELVINSILASQVDPFDPMEKAFHALGQDALPAKLESCRSWSLVREYPLASTLLAHSHLWRTDQPERHVLTMKGAPETVVQLCRLNTRAAEAVAAQIDAMAGCGLRVLAVARSGPLTGGAGDTWPASQRDFDLEFLGLVGLADPVRATVPAAIAECRAAGVRTVMITGDYPRTAVAIAERAGLARNDSVMTGNEIALLDDAALAMRINSVDVFARVIPVQKLRIVDAFKSAGEVVAMTGDGVNDAPALKAAHVGIAMGKRGTDVAREAASLVLLQDDFAAIVQAIRMGRRIFDNIQKAMRYILAVHVPTVGIMLLSLLSGGPLVLYPLHVVFLEFVIDPACSIVFEAEPAERDCMRRPPRQRSEELFNNTLIAAGILQGLCVFAAAAALYVVLLKGGADAASVRAMTFAVIVLGNVGLIFANRTQQHSLRRVLDTPNPAFWLVVTSAVVGLVLTIQVPALAELFRFKPLAPLQWFWCIAFAVAGLSLFSGIRVLRPQIVWRAVRN